MHKVSFRDYISAFAVKAHKMKIFSRKYLLYKLAFRIQMSDFLN